MNKKWKITACGCLPGLAMLAALAVFGGRRLVSQMPELSAQYPLGSAPVLVTLTSPLNDAHYPVNSAIPVRVTAFGAEPAYTLELWVDGALMEAQEVAPDVLGKAHIEWPWTPDGEGEHILLARVRTPQGKIGDSNLVRITATAPVGMSVQVTASEGDTLASLAERFQSPVEELQPAVWDESQGTWSLQPYDAAPENVMSTEGGQAADPQAGQTPGGDAQAGGAQTGQPPAPGAESGGPQGTLPQVDPNAPLSPGQPVLVPGVVNLPPSTAKLPPAEPPTGPTRSVEAIDPNKVSLWIGNLLTSPSAAPAAPSLAALANGCEIRLFITDQAHDEQGFFVYQGGGGSTALQRIAVLAANQGSLPLEYSTPGQVGSVVYVAAAFNAAGETPSQPVSVSLDAAACGIATDGLAWQGDALVLPQPVDLAYFYLSTDGNSWERVPAPAQAFFAARGQPPAGRGSRRLCLPRRR